MRFFGGKRAALILYRPSSAAAIVLLPQAGPFASLGAFSVSGLANYNSGGTVSANSRTSPNKFNNCNLIGGTISTDFSQLSTAAIFIWANKVQLGTAGGAGAIRADANPGEDGFASGAISAGGIGGSGGSGGGGGTSNMSAHSTTGGGGGSGTDGDPGFSCGCNITGDGGIGYGTQYNTGYAWPNGSDGSTDGFSAAGFGGAGFGGGGSGGSCPDPGFACVCGIIHMGSGGGGGGGSLAAVVCNEFIVGHVLSAITAFGASGGTGSIDGGCGGPTSASNGGDGVVFVAAKKWTNTIIPNLSGNVYFYEITHANALVLRANWKTSSWNNL